MKRSICAKLLLTTFSRVRSTYGFSQSYFHSVILSVTWKMPKFIEPMLSEQSSGLARRGAASRSSMLMPSEPPVVMLMTESQFCLMRGRNCMKTLGSGVGLPSLGLRACRWMIDAPASDAAIDSRAISSGVIGR